MLKSEHPKATRLAVALSWVALLAALLFLGFTAWFIPSDRHHFISIYHDFDMELPASTRFMLAIPDLAFTMVALVLAFALLGGQMLIRAKNAIALVHMLIIVLCCVVIVGYRESLFQPMSSLMRKLAGD